MSYSLTTELKHKEYYIALLQLEIKAYKKAMEDMIKNYRQMGLDARYTPMIFRDTQTREWNMPRYTNKVEKELLDAWKEQGMVSWSDIGITIKKIIIHLINIFFKTRVHEVKILKLILSEN